MYRLDEFSDPTEALTRLAWEALTLGAVSVTVSRTDDWLILSADVDWLARVGDRVFVDIVAAPEIGRNAMFWEVVVAVAHPHVVTWTDGTLRSVKGSQKPVLDHETLNGPGRGIALLTDPPPAEGTDTPTG